jgi:hypothetical protein
LKFSVMLNSAAQVLVFTMLTSYSTVTDLAKLRG